MRPYGAVAQWQLILSSVADDAAMKPALDTSYGSL